MSIRIIFNLKGAANMQLIESIIFLLVIITSGLLIVHKLVRKKFMIVIAGATTIALILHVIIENTRWQLFPLYIVAIILIGMSMLFIFNKQEFQRKRTIRIISLVLSGILIVVSGASIYVFPVNEIPLPSGEFSIGTESFVLIDENREELYGTEGNRKIKIQVWYPAESTEGYDLVPWLEDGRVVAKGEGKGVLTPSEKTIGFSCGFLN